MASFKIEGGHLLNGTIKPQGAKNEALQVICATLLTSEEVVIHNIPDIRDVNNMIKLLCDIGVKVRKVDSQPSADNSYYFQADQLNMEFLLATFPKLQNLRPGKWHITKLGNRNTIKTSSFAQYEHLDYLTRLTAYDKKLAASMGNDYMVAPDVVVYRETEPDEEINSVQIFVDDTVCTMADIREKNGGLPILHASVSAKWTMR